MDLDRLAQLMRAVADDIILPRFRALGEGDIEEKSKGDFVTIADREAELALTPELLAMVPGSVVVGEEATAADPTLLEAAQSDGPVWYVDPIDGTANFIKGLPTFAVMIAFARGGEVRQSAIFFPASGDLYRAEKGAGAYCETTKAGTERLPLRTKPQALKDARAAFYTKHFPNIWATPLQRLRGNVAAGSNELAAACEYTDIAAGRKDIATYHRMLPWDHAPGSLILREVGGVARDFVTNENYRPAHIHGPHLLAANEELWQAGQAVLTQG